MCTETSINHGYNVKRLREILGIKQEMLAEKLGVTQQTISQLETREVIDEGTLQKIAELFNVSVDAIKNFKDDKAMNVFINSLNDNEGNGINFGTQHEPTYNFNPIEKIVELYEQLGKEKEEKIALLERLLEETKKQK